jgi:hypothetical protein
MALQLASVCRASIQVYTKIRACCFSTYVSLNHCDGMQLASCVHAAVLSNSARICLHLLSYVSTFREGKLTHTYVLPTCTPKTFWGLRRAKRPFCTHGSCQSRVKENVVFRQSGPSGNGPNCNFVWPQNSHLPWSISVLLQNQMTILSILALNNSIDQDFFEDIEDIVFKKYSQVNEQVNAKLWSI